MESQKKHPRNFSFEFFPPKTPEGAQKLSATWQQLAQLKPRFFSVTYGAGGSTRERTLATVMEIRQAGFHAAPHISCIGSTRADIAETLEIPLGTAYSRLRLAREAFRRAVVREAARRRGSHPRLARQP